MNPLAALSAASDHVDGVLRQVAADHWDRPSPCPGWTVADVADHVIGGNRWAVLLLAGAPGREALDTIRAGSFGPDRLADFRASVTAQSAAFAAPGALDREVDHLIGRIPARQFIGMRLTDSVIHAWDLARGAGVDEALPADLVELLLAQLEPLADGLARSGNFGAGQIGAPEPTSRQQRLLQLTGRRP